MPIRDGCSSRLILARTSFSQFRIVDDRNIWMLDEECPKMRNQSINHQSVSLSIVQNTKVLNACYCNVLPLPRDITIWLGKTVKWKIWKIRWRDTFGVKNFKSRELKLLAIPVLYCYNCHFTLRKAYALKAFVISLPHRFGRIQGWGRKFATDDY